MSKAKDMANIIRAMCRSLDSPIPKEWSDLEVLQFATQMVQRERNIREYKQDLASGKAQQGRP